MTLNLCPNCGYNNAQPVSLARLLRIGEDYLVKDAEGNQMKNSDGTDTVKSYACARCGCATAAKPAPAEPEADAPAKAA